MSNSTKESLLKWAETELSRSGIESAKRETELLLSRCSDIGLFQHLIKRRASRYPLQYIVQETEFMGLPLKLKEGVFIPRPETELLVEKILEIMANTGDRTVDILEIGTGSGNIPISLTKNVTNCRIIASDISDTALAIASQNAEMNAVSEKIKFIKSDLFGNIPGIYLNYFDIIISNPPYVKRGEIKQLQPEISYEDTSALDGGCDGLDFYHNILGKGRRYLKTGGIFAFEIGYDQREAVAKIIGKYPELGKAKSFKDYNGHDRIVIVEKHG
ncbi:MAG: peptide chain release factor N(5)-glutamine methyltransferase [Candidatus Omnitrophica bacterium]|nr:peptide chain release factor N(5)-glutamine methyltransferase [Candidatus Omnitrophota bacterium]